MADIRVKKLAKPVRDFFKSHPIRESTKAVPQRAMLRKKRRSRKWFWILIGVLTIVGFYVVRAVGLKQLVNESATAIKANFQNAKQALSALDSQTAQTELEAADQKIQTIKNEADKFGLLRLATFWEGATKTLKGIPATIKSVVTLSKGAVQIATLINDLKQNGLSYTFSKQGPELIQKLVLFRDELKQMPDLLTTLRTNEALISGFDDTNQLFNTVEIYRNIQMLDALIAWLDTPLSKHVVIFFENTSEIRPGGGFIGSYADITLNHGSVETIEVRDTYDPDGQLTAIIIPPEPLQLITKKWGARDANWFFDFPTSAKKVLSFLNSSAIYRDRVLEFSDAISININVLADIIGVVGQLELSDYQLTLTSKNAVAVLQREVESGADKANGEPKKILKVLMPILIEKLKTMSEAERTNLLEMFHERLVSRDIRMYTENIVLQSYLQSYGITGDVAATPETGISEYIAAVNANIGGAKSDAMIQQHITFESQIDLEGVITNKLSVTRKHIGTATDEPWYRATNRNYLQLYTSLGSKALTSSGRAPWPTNPKWDYSNFRVDPDVRSLEQTIKFNEALRIDSFRAFGKTVFAAWLTTAAGETKTFTLDYQNPQSVPAVSKIPYTLIFEKQSGVKTALTITLEAPPGYTWEEINSPNFKYSIDDPPGRLVITLTLIKRAN